METQTRIGSPYSVVIGRKIPDRVLPAMPIRIVYLDAERDYLPASKAGEHYFKMSVPKNFTPGWGLNSSWDAFELRKNFERLSTPDEALPLLNVIGTFRYKRSKGGNVLSWSEIQGWQQVIHRLRLRDSSEWFPRLGLRDPDCRESFRHFVDDAGLGEFSEQIWSVSDETFAWLQGFPQGLSIRRDMYLSREEMEGIFSSPSSRVPDSREWHYAQSVLARKRAERARGDSEGKQKLIAEVTPATALDAILATVYVDKLRGMDLQVCALRECNEMFERREGHGKMYCSQAHAHLASVRRKRAEARTRKLKRSSREGKSK